MSGPSVVEVIASERVRLWEQTFQNLVRFASVFEAEGDIVDYVERWLLARQISVVRVPHDSSVLASLPTAQRPFSLRQDRSSIVARLPGLGGGRSLVLNTHLDVVPADSDKGWTHPPFGAEIDQTKRVLYGRGAMDDKAGVAIGLGLIDLLQALGQQLRGDLIFHFVLEDETTGNGSLLCLEAGYGADGAVIIDGTRSDRAINQHAGQVQVKVAVQGRSASVSVSHLGVNAIELLSELTLELRELVFALNANRVAPWTRFPSPFQLVVQSMHGEGLTLTVPDRAVAVCYATFPPPLSLSQFRAMLDEHIREFASRRNLPTLPEVDWSGFSVEPVMSDSNQVGTYLAAGAARVGVGPIEVGPSTGTSDLRHFVGARIPCVLYGPGRGFNPHRADEHFYLDDLPVMVRLFLEFAKDWCGT